ncbi:MAG: hypothetical protein ABR941_06600 [Thermoleophilia bacterium]
MHQTGQTSKGTPRKAEQTSKGAPRKAEKHEDPTFGLGEEQGVSQLRQSRHRLGVGAVVA